MIQSSDLIDWPKILLVEFDYRYYRFNRIFGYRLRALVFTEHEIFVSIFGSQDLTWVSIASQPDQ